MTLSDYNVFRAFEGVSVRTVAKIFFLLVLSLSAYSETKIFKCIVEGKIVFSDEICSDSAELIRLKKINRFNSSSYVLYEKSDLYESSKNSSKKTARKIIIGPRGGQYYINKNGNKTYIKKD